MENIDEFANHLQHCIQSSDINVYCHHCNVHFTSHSALSEHQAYFLHLSLSTPRHTCHPLHTSSQHSSSPNSSFPCGQAFCTPLWPSDLSDNTELTFSPISSMPSPISLSVVPETPPCVTSPIYTTASTTPCPPSYAFRWPPVTQCPSPHALPSVFLQHSNDHQALINHLSLILYWLTSLFLQVPASFLATLPSSSDYLYQLITSSPFWPSSIPPHATLTDVITHIQHHLCSIIYH